MTHLAEIEAHIATMSELRDIVGAMRSLSGMRMQEAQRVLPGIRRYAEVMASGIADTLLIMGQPELPRNAQGQLALVLCTAEHGFVGGFNERLVEAAQSTLGPRDSLFVLGSRGASRAFDQQRPPSWKLAMATRCAAAPETVQRLSAELYPRMIRGEIARVAVMFARYRQGATATIERRLLLPLDLVSLEVKRVRPRPLHNLDPVALHERLVAEYVFALLTEAVVESIASENAARLAAMGSAHDNVSKELERLRQDALQARQSEITTELIELVTGAQAVGQVDH
jgi:F-type H+-transporting ATPase subunit gamma